MIEQEHPPPKKTLCRFYMRGLCIYPNKECPFAHGVWDLNYDYYREGDEIQYDYQKSKDSIQKGIKGPRIYKNLYDFQTDKIFTLDQLNHDRQARNIVRYRLHLQLYDQFIQLLEIKHPDIIFTEEFLVREFTRAGFNKISMSSLKYNHIATYLCDNPDSRFFRSTKIIPPSPQKQNILVKRASFEEIIAEYKSATKKIIEESKQIDESTLKKKIYNAKMSQNTPPLNILLKDLKVNIKQFIQQYLTFEGVVIIPECTVQSVEKQAVAFLEKELPQRMVEWSEIFQYISKTLNSNNGNLINQVRPHLVKKGYAFLFFPMMQFLYHNSIQSHFGAKSIPPCKCNFQKPYDQEQLLLTTLQKAEPLIEGESYDIYNYETLNKCAPHILSSSVLGVDLEGRLRKGGFVEMVQLNNGRNTFLFDIWHMNELGQFEAFWLAKKILRNVMVNQNIVKIFHDCRYDSIGLHEMLETCIINVFDTSAVQTLISQVQAYQKLWKQQHKDYLSDCKQIIANCNNVKTPGLNQILKKYQASHGINKNKDKFHKMWSKGELSFFCKRPIDPEYRDYCIRDVLDLPQVYEKMLSCLNSKTENIAYWVSKEYAKQGYESIINEDK